MVTNKTSRDLSNNDASVWPLADSQGDYSTTTYSS